MELNIVIILGLFGVLTGRVSTETTEEWSEWKVLQEYPICFLIRTRNCTTVNCTESEKEYRYCKDIASWEEWGPLQCIRTNNSCVLERTRDCSVKTLSDCYSNDTNRDVSYLENSKPCPCGEAGGGSALAPVEWSEWHVLVETPKCILVRSRQCTSNGCNEDEKEYQYCKDIASWGEWGPLQCTVTSNTCFIARTRTCSITDTPNCYSDATGTDLTFLGDIKSCPCGEGNNSSKPTAEWSEWKVLQKNQTCFLMRRRHCLTQGCNKTETEYKYCQEVASWEAWGPLQCTVKYNTCFIVRSRNCSAQGLSDCYSNEDNSDVTVWGNFKSCPCGEGRTGTTVQGSDSGHWEEWNNWKCSTFSNRCFVYRTRQCSVQSSSDCPTPEGSEIKLWTGICPCQNNSISRIIQNDTSVNGLSSPASWQEWGSWQCHDVDKGCIQIRYRHCSSNGDDCNGKSYEFAICEGDTCSAHSSGATTTATPVDLVPWSSWKCHNELKPCVMYRYRNCLKESGLVMNCSTEHYEMIECDESCKDGPTHNTTAGQYTPIATTVSHITSSVAASFSTSSTVSNKYSSAPSINSVGPTTPTVYVPPYCLEWSGWKCENKSTGECTVTRNRSCSTDVDECKLNIDGYCTQTENCSSSICAATWTLGNWNCKIGKNGSCIMTRTLDCSTGDPKDCVTETATDTVTSAECDEKVCPEKVKLAVQCKGYVSGEKACTDASTCNKIDNPFHPICELEHMSHDICPKACGCCDAVKEESSWLEWSAWKCSIAANRSCEMIRKRNCSIPGDCPGASQTLAKCSDKICPEVMKAAEKTDCSAFDPSTSTCNDHKGCYEFRTEIALDVVCSEPKLASDCPVTCGCCKPLPTTTVTTKQTSIIATTTTTTTQEASSPTKAMPELTSSNSAVVISSIKPVTQDNTSPAKAPASPHPVTQGNTSSTIATTTPNPVTQENKSPPLGTATPIPVTQGNTSPPLGTATPIPVTQGNTSPPLGTATPIPVTQGNTSPPLGTTTPNPVTQGNTSPPLGTATPNPVTQGNTSSPLGTATPNPVTHGNTSSTVATTTPNPVTQGNTSPPLGTASPNPVTQGNISPSLGTATPNPVTQGNTSPPLGTATPIPVTQGNTSPPLGTATSNPVTQGNTSPTLATTTPNPVTQGNTSPSLGTASPNPVTQENTSPPQGTATPNLVTQGNTSPPLGTASTNPVTQGNTSQPQGTATSNPITQENTSPPLGTATANPVTQENTSPPLGTATANPVTQGNTSPPLGTATPDPVTQENTSPTVATTTPNPVTQGNTSPPLGTASPNPVTQGNTSPSLGTATPNPVTQENTSPPLGTATQNPLTQGNTSPPFGTGTPNPVTQGNTSSPLGTASSNPVTQGNTSPPLGTATPNPVTQGNTSPTVATAAPNPVTQGNTSPPLGTATPNPVTQENTSPALGTASPNPVTQGNTSPPLGTATPNPVSQENTSRPLGTATPNPVTQGNTSLPLGTASPNPVTQGNTSPPLGTATPNPVTQGNTSPPLGTASPNPVTQGNTSLSLGTSSANPISQGNTSSHAATASPTNSNGTTTVNETQPSTSNKTTQAPKPPEPEPTTQAAVKTTVHKQPVTNPPVPVTCKVCAGPEFLCEKLYMDKQCEYPNNYCINKLTNHLDGSRSVVRSCGNFDTCYRDWFLGSSDSDKCRRFDENSIITLDFSCTFCCVNDNCNLPIRPNLDTLYIDV